MEEICSACLTSGRWLSSLNETDYFLIYSQILGEISVSSWEGGVHVCWECLCVLRRWTRFKRDVQKAALHLMQHDLLTQPAPAQPLSRLQPHSLFSFSYCSKLDPDVQQDHNDTDPWDVSIHSVKIEPLECDDVKHEDDTHDGVIHEDDTHDDVIHEDDTHDDVIHEDDTHDGVIHEDNTHDDVIHEDDTHDDVIHVRSTRKRKRKPNYVTDDDVTHDDVTHVRETRKRKRKRKTKKSKVKLKTHKSAEQKQKDLITNEDDFVSFIVEQNETENDINVPVSSISVIDVPLFECKRCCGRFETDEKLAIHLCHRIKKKSQELKGDSTDKDKPHCDICKKHFSTKKTFKYHMSTLHGDSGGSHKCEECGRRYRWQSNLARHKRTHKALAAGQLYCSVCDKRFASVATFRTHLALSSKHITDNDKPCVCEECGARFVTKTRLRDHIDWEHLHKIKYRCSICDKPFKSHTSLYIHMNNVHHNKGRKDVLCHICGKAYQNVCKLRSHVAATHGDAPAHRCSCGAAFTWHSSYYRHHRHCAAKTTSKKTKDPPSQETLDVTLPT